MFSRVGGGEHVNTGARERRRGLLEWRGCRGGEGRTLLFSHHGSENEHVSEGGVWEGAPASQASLRHPPPDGSVEERRPTCRWKEADVFFFHQMSGGHHQGENQR